ncbi:IS481 family transposase [Winogradskyella tangerina]|uniref:IS481 family transposase n=1 Tax=Winogradskyella tangerina TaxID=2023240 RepID=UPI000DBE4358|nr:IS481 family transposase [Winogradskyella tangerina]
MTREQRHDIKRKLDVFDYAKKVGNINKACRHYGISKTTYFNWLKRYQKDGEKGLINNKPCPENIRLRTPIEVEEKVLYLRKKYHFGPERIYMYLKRYLDIETSESSVYRILKRNGISRLPRNAKRRSPGPKFKRYEKQTPGHHIQMDVKFLTFTDKQGKSIKRYQYTAIDDATRIRALKVYNRHNQNNAIDFLNYVIKKFPFRIKMVRTDNGHEFQARFHWHCQDQGIEHVYIKPGTPRLNGKVERSHLTDKLEFYQLIEYTSDVDLGKKMNEWENFYNFNRPHKSHGGLTPYEVFRAKMNINIQS